MLTLPEIAPFEGEAWEEHAGRLAAEMASEGNATTRRLTYRVVIHPVNAADYGAAQKRRRVVVVGFRSDEPLVWEPPGATHSREALLWDKWISGDYWTRHGVAQRARPAMPASERALVDRLRSRGEHPPTAAWRTVRDAIHDLGDPRLERETIANHRLQPGARSFSGHTGSPLVEAAKALKAGDHGVPGGENMLAKPDGSVRYFSVREAARLQGFPDDFVFPASVSWTESMRQLGNAVPTQLAGVFGEAIARTLSAEHRVRLRAA